MHTTSYLPSERILYHRVADSTVINCPYSVINATPLALDLFLLHPGNTCRHPRIYLTRDVMQPMGTSRVDCVCGILFFLPIGRSPFEF